MSDAVRMRGGLVLEPCGDSPASLDILKMPAPARLVLPLAQHRGAPAKPLVSAGDHVRAGQMIAAADGLISAPLHAPVAGRIVGLEPRSGLRGAAQPCIVLQTVEDTERSAPSVEAPADLSTPPRPLELRRAIAAAGIAGLGGAAFPTAVKLAAQADARLHTLVINGAECDPGIYCDDALMQRAPSAILQGTQRMLAALDIHRAVIAIKADKTRALGAVNSALEQLHDARITTTQVPARYPMGGERQLIQYLSGREVPIDGLPMDVGFLCHNVATAYAVHMALDHSQPLTSRIVSVAGSAVKTPAIVEVPLGTSVADVLAFCGGCFAPPAMIVLGGRMMGTAIHDDAVPITKEVNAIEAFAEAPTAPDARACIRCGECATVCPASLQPQSLHWHAAGGQLDALLEHHLGACIECGCCDAVCPSHLPLTAQFKSAKHAVYQRDHERLVARHARARFDARNQRLERLKHERAERRAKRQARATKAPVATRKKDILDAVARAKRARAEREQQRDR